MCKWQTPLINSFISEKKTTEVTVSCITQDCITKSGVTQDCIIELGIILSTFTTGVI